jgi:hypothetical protein
MQSTDLTRLEAVAHLRAKWGLSFTNGSLANMAVAKIGPAFYRRSGRTYYPIATLDDFAKARLGPLLKALVKHSGGL